MNNYKNIKDLFAEADVNLLVKIIKGEIDFKDAAKDEIAKRCYEHHKEFISYRNENTK